MELLLYMAGCHRHFPKLNRTLQRGVVVFLLSLAVAHALPNAEVPPLVLPGGGSRAPISGKPERQNSLNFASRSNSPAEQVVHMSTPLPFSARLPCDHSAPIAH